MRKKYKPYIKVFIQIFLIVSMSWAFSYIVHQTDNLVSAQSSEIKSVCLKDKEGAICQEYFEDCDALPNDCCDAKCNNTYHSCIQTPINAVSECNPGFCYDVDTGVCSTNAPKLKCEEDGGIWSSTNLIECEMGCCIYGSQTTLFTQKQCELISPISQFDSTINTGIDCYIESLEQIEGACIHYSGEDKICTFGTGTECPSGSSFNANFLCSHPDLEMGYEKMFTTGCVDEKDEVYWFDDHGNKENIYEGANSIQRDSSWNNGLVKSKNDSCSLGDFNFGICGNCDVFTNSRKCGEATANEKLEVGDVVCRDISCWDDINKKDRLNGETWCYYQGSVLPKEGSLLSLHFNRSTATPGSRHFVMECRDGDIINTSCENQRESICTETQYLRDDNTNVSIAGCRKNMAISCLNYNEEYANNPVELKEKCEENPDCFVKNVVVPDSKFWLSTCVPKYPQGFDISKEGMGSAICSIASASCRVARVKTATGKWKWYNKGCTTSSFTTQMNDFCMSLGDCGGSVNYIGEYGSEGYDISGPKVTAALKYDDHVSTGEYIESSNVDELLRALGDKVEWEGGFFTGLEDFPGGAPSGSFYQGGLSLGTSGLGLAMAGVEKGSTWILTYGKVGGPVLGAAIGAVLGAALVDFLISWLKLGPGLSRDLAATLVTLGIVGGGLAGLSLAGGASIWGGTGLLASGPVGGIILLVIVVYMVVSASVGVGRMKEYNVVFQCNRWQPPIGGDDCDKCYDDGFGCSEYACEALGTACEFLNEGTPYEECAEFPDDMTPPQINPWEEALSEGFDYTEVSDSGFRIISKDTNDGCVPALTFVSFGLQLHEPGKCVFSVEGDIFNEEEIEAALEQSNLTPEDFGLTQFDTDALSDELPSGIIFDTGIEKFPFGGNVLYLYNHTHALYFPSLLRLGAGGWDPDRREDFDMKIICMDRHGHPNPIPYVIRTCVRPEEKTQPPFILDKDPIDGLVKNDATHVNFSIYTNEPANCSWDIEDKEYTEMVYPFDCKTEDDEVTSRLGVGTCFECSYLNAEMPSNNLTIYARCEDQPWEILPEETRNVMNKSDVFTLTKSSPLEIDSVILNEGKKLEFGTTDIQIEVEVETSGGGYNGESICSHRYKDRWIDLLNTGGTIHSQIFPHDSSGDYVLSIKCEDDLGNTAFNDSTFTIVIDNDAPKITRAFKDGTKLKIFTDEKAACYYDYNKCNFDIENASLMSIGLSAYHTADWSPGTTYYIKCKDIWDNWDSRCSIIIKPQEI